MHHQSSRCHVTLGDFGHVDAQQVPLKAKPWSSIAAHTVLNSVDLIVSEDHHEVLQQGLSQFQGGQCYYRAYMTLGQLLSDEVYSKLAKTREKPLEFLAAVCSRMLNQLGGVFMMSKAMPRDTSVFSVDNGLLSIHLDKQTYERSGLSGKPRKDTGSDQRSTAWIMSYDLHSPLLDRGQPDFNRLLRACDNVFSHTQPWIICDTSASTQGLDLPREAITVKRPSSTSSKIDIPIPIAVTSQTGPLREDNREELQDVATELYEWIALVKLQSPRVMTTDDIDPYLSRYRVPESNGRTTVRKISWHGVMTATWLQSLLVHVLATLPGYSWFSLSATGGPFLTSSSGYELTIVRLSGSAGKYLMWEIK